MLLSSLAPLLPFHLKALELEYLARIASMLLLPLSRPDTALLRPTGETDLFLSLSRDRSRDLSLGLSLSLSLSRSLSRDLLLFLSRSLSLLLYGLSSSLLTTAGATGFLSKTGERDLLLLLAVYES